MTPAQPNSDTRITSIRKGRSASGLARRRYAMTRGFVRRHLWIAPVLALVALVFAATWLRSYMEQAMRGQTEGQLRALLTADVTALKLWLRSQEANAEAAAETPDIRRPILQLTQLSSAGDVTAATLLQAPQRAELTSELKPWFESLGFVGYVILDRQFLVLASSADNQVGQKSPQGYASFTKAVLDGRALVSPPFPSTIQLLDEWNQMSAGVPTMFAAAPVHDDEGAVVAVLALRIRPNEEFTKILNVGRMGSSGETYAFNEQGTLISQSRFEDQLKRLGLQVDLPHSRSVLAVQVRDPEVDMTRGERPTKTRADQNLTFMAQSAIATKPTEPVVNVEGYRDYRGVDSIGAWVWLKDYGFGVATEVDKAEAFSPIYILRTAFWTLFGLLSAAAVSLLGLTLLAGRLDRRMREAVIAAGRLGQYTLEQKIGEGGMGSVYRARHAMLRRATAVKLLEPSRTTDVSIARFEREVQLTSELNHPNTITIFDYGRTQEGIFYYAMEYLDGFSLQSLVERFGPQPDGRVIQILLQVCGSLSEAHSRGLIHRDIKPANIMLTQQGGVLDFVKLLDFGLVKAIDSRQQRTLTAANTVTGTPLYIPPETVQDPDLANQRSDLYSLGGVAYFLLTGHPVFDGGHVMEIIQHHLTSRPVPPSERAPHPISRDLEQVVLQCLAKAPEDRPASAAEVAEALARCVPLQPWTAAERELWWKQIQPAGPGDATLTNTMEVKLAPTMAYSDLQRKE